MRNVLKTVNLFDTTNRVNESSVDSYSFVSLGFRRPFHLQPKIVFQLIEFDFREHSCKINTPPVTFAPIAGAFIGKFKIMSDIH